MTDVPPLSDELRRQIDCLADDLDEFRTRRPRAALPDQLESRRAALLSHLNVQAPDHMLTCIGDSNIMFFAGAERLRFIRYRRSAILKPHWINRGLDLLPCFRVFHVGPSTAWKASDLNSSTRAWEKIEILLKKDIPLGSRVLLSFGEIDCRIHMVRAIQGGKSLEEVTEATATKFMRLPLHLLERGYRPIIWAPPQIIPKDENLTSPTFPFLGPWELRRDITYAYVDHLRTFGSRAGIPVVCLAGQYHDPKKKAHKSFFHDGTHLSQRLMPLAISHLANAAAFSA